MKNTFVYPAAIFVLIALSSCVHLPARRPPLDTAAQYDEGERERFYKEYKLNYAGSIWQDEVYQREHDETMFIPKQVKRLFAASSPEAFTLYNKALTFRGFSRGAYGLSVGLLAGSLFTIPRMVDGTAEPSLYVLLGAGILSAGLGVLFDFLALTPFAEAADAYNRYLREKLYLPYSDGGNEYLFKFREYHHVLNRGGGFPFFTFSRKF